MNLLEQIRPLLKEYKEIEIPFDLLETPTDRTMADVALPCFQLAKAARKAPHMIAQEIAASISSTEIVERIEAIGPYVNFFFSSEFLASSIIPTILDQQANYGKRASQNETLLIEGRQPNTHKVYHIGHLRNELVSETVCRICEAGGYNVIRCSYKGDVGAHVAKRLWYYVNFDNAPIPEHDISSRAAEIYVKAGQKIDENPSLYKQQIHDIHQKMEDGDAELQHIISVTKEGCLADIREINEELGSTIEREYLESEVEQPGIEIVKKLKKNGTAGIHYSEGAIIINLEEYNLGVFVILKSNGASLYSTKDIALAYLKQEEYQFDKSLYIVATEQIHHFNQLFKTLELIGYEGADKLEHVSYGMVELASGKMSSREGNVVTYYELRDKMIQAAHTLIEERDIQNKDAVARSVAFGAMKFDMLLQDAYKKIIFDMDRALSFSGETGPYIQYTHARCSSILAKAPVQEDTIDFSKLGEQEERSLLLHLQTFGETIAKAADEYKPNLVARYLLDLAHLFNSYYQKHTILHDDQAVQNSRLALVKSVKQVLKNGLEILGIDALDSM